MDSLQINQSKSVIQTLQDHVSIREFVDREVSIDILRTIINAARRSPTSSNMQAYSIIIVRDAERKNKIASLAGNQKFITEASAFIAICADLSKQEIAAKMHGQNLAKNLEISTVAIVDAALVGMSISLAAESLGLGTTMIGGIRNNIKAVSEYLNLPKSSFVLFGMAIGWPDWKRVKTQKPRMPEELIVYEEKVDESRHEELLKEYDRMLYSHYTEEGRITSKDSWTKRVATSFSKPRRAENRKILEDIGFRFD